MKEGQCIIFGFIYGEAKGWPDEGIAPGTRWQDVPQDWLCPQCGASEADFAVIEIYKFWDITGHSLMGARW